jgi:hypothetical protein
MHDRLERWMWAQSAIFSGRRGSSFLNTASTLGYDAENANPQKV